MEIKRRILTMEDMEKREKSHILGGSMSNINEADGCSCSGSSNGWFFCNDNSNAQKGCTCIGENDNSNEKMECSCS